MGTGTMVVGFSGKKQSGKNTSANYLAGRYLVRTGQINEFRLNKFGQLEVSRAAKQGRVNPFETIAEGELNIAGFMGIKLYSFADPLKQFCMDVFGLSREQCYGTDEQKNSLTQLRWEEVPSTESSGGRTGFMTAREVLQYVGTDLIRRMDPDAWARATIASIKRDGYELAIITDARFPNEIDAIKAVGGKAVRLVRNVAGADGHSSETALDDYPLYNYACVLENASWTIEEQCEKFRPFVDEWLVEAMAQ